MKAIYYLDLVSSWCVWAEPAWAELKRRYAGVAEFEWRIALMDESGLPSSRAKCDWFYRRSGIIVRSPFMLHSGWVEPGRTEYLAPNLVAEAARDLGVSDDRARLALAHAAMREGRPVGQLDVSVAAAAAATGLDPDLLRAHAKTEGVLKQVRDTTEEFRALRVSQRPAFVLENAIGDRAVFSGLVAVEPMAATIEAMLADARAYTSWNAHFGGPPPE